MKPVKELRLAIAALTIFPVRLQGEDVTDANLAAARHAFPVVGGLIGLVLAGLSHVLERFSVPPMLAALGLTAAGVALTGGLHLDGVADTADGLFLTGGAERRLAVMRDSHIGSFGVVALILVLLGKFAALASLSGRARSLGILVASVVGRCGILVSAGVAGYARPEGTGRIVVEATTGRDAVGAAVVAVAVGLGFRGWAGGWAAAGALGAALGLARLAGRRLGGVTGDILGCSVELGEVVVLVILGAR